MAIKIDVAKAYDRVEWKLFLHIMSLHGFNDKFYNLMRSLVLWNLKLIWRKRMTV